MHFSNLDFLVKEWEGKLLSIGMNATDAKLLARIKARMEIDLSFAASIRNGGLEGFARWVEIHCKDIYYAVKNALQSAWDWLKSQF